MYLPKISLGFRGNFHVIFTERGPIILHMMLVGRLSYLQSSEKESIEQQINYKKKYYNYVLYSRR